MEKAKVYFTKNIDASSLIKMYDILNTPLTGRVAVKISTGEKGNPNYLKPSLIKDLVSKLNGTIVECNTAYEGKRNDTKSHMETVKEHGFLDIANVDIMDSESDMPIPVVKGRHLKENYVGKNLENYDSLLILSHFKGHPMGGFGGAIKNISIGVASSAGKTNIHTAGKTKDVKTIWQNTAPQDDFLESMAEASLAVVNYMKTPIVYINVMNNLTVDCDCVAHPEGVCMKDIGILSSLNPVALDKACVDLLYQVNDDGKNEMIERITTRNGIHTLDYAEEIGLGTKEYELISLD